MNPTNEARWRAAGDVIDGEQQLRRGCCSDVVHVVDIIVNAVSCLGVYMIVVVPSVV